ncbi:MAG: heparinase II/III family protein [Armatimonadetes bacterium]|nr:heparinase II/III family protein [Armatimonadota bacterium]
MKLDRTLICVVFSVSLAAVRGETLVPRQARLVINDFERGAAGWQGGELDTAVARQGRASLRWDHHTERPQLVCTNPPADWSGFDLLEFWMYSATANGALLRLIIVSENPETEGLDYWSKSIVVDWAGWHLFRVRLADLDTARRPLGWSHVQRFFFSATGWECEPRPDTCLWLDDVALANPLARLSIVRWSRLGDNAARVSLKATAITDQPVTAVARIPSLDGFRFHVDPASVSIAPAESRSLEIDIQWQPGQELWRLMRQRIAVQLISNGETADELSFPGLRAYLATLAGLQHPRVLSGSATFQAMRDKIRRQAWAREMWRNREARADALAERFLRGGITDGERADIETGRSLMEAALTLAFAYQLTGEPAYAAASAKAIEAAGQWANWVYEFHRPIVYDLGTAACLRYFGTAYDWIHSGLSEAQQQALAEILWTRGLQAYEDATRANVWWARAYRNNWLAVCAAGAALAAAALLDQRPEAADILSDAYDRVCALLDEGGADGGWPEGVSYWAYGIGHAAVFAEALYQLTGGQINLFEHPYLRETWKFGLYMSAGRNGAVNFCDCSYSWPDPYLMLLLGVRAGRPEAVWYFREKPSYSIEAGLIYDEGLKARPPEDLPLSRHFRGIDWIVLRSGFARDDVVVGLRGGNNGENHGQLEAGNFVISARDERLVLDYGAAAYTREYFSASRWSFYRANTHGNNCLLIDDQDQLPGRSAVAKTTFFDTTPDFDFVRMDLTSAYGRDAQRVERCVAFIKPDIVVLCDTARTGAEHMFTWRFHPAPDFKIESGSVTAKAGSRWMWAGFVASSQVEISSGKHERGEPYVDVATRSKVSKFDLVAVFWVPERESATTPVLAPIEVSGGLGVRMSVGSRTTIVAMRTDPSSSALVIRDPRAGFETDAQAVAMVFDEGRLVRLEQAGGKYVRQTQP